MPLDILGSTRATMRRVTCSVRLGADEIITPSHNVGLFIDMLNINKECLVSVYHQCALTMSLPFVHTAHRTY